jgi:hypothetical protein
MDYKKKSLVMLGLITQSNFQMDKKKSLVTLGFRTNHTINNTSVNPVHNIGVLLQQCLVHVFGF